jgi:RES domain-containing protein
MPTSGPTLEQLKSRLQRLLPSAMSFAATCYRSSTPKYATEFDVITGAGSQQHGGRWNPIGVACVYASLTPETAMAEALAHHRYYGIPVEEAMPRTFVAIQAQLGQVLDFRNGSIRQRLQLSEERSWHWIGGRRQVRAANRSRK